MEIKIQSVHFDASEQLKEFTQRKISKLEKYLSDSIVVTDVILKVVKPESPENKEASIKINVKNGQLFADKTADTFEEAVDLAVDALEKQLLKFKEKVDAK